MTQSEHGLGKRKRPVNNQSFGVKGWVQKSVQGEEERGACCKAALVGRSENQVAIVTFAAGDAALKGEYGQL